MLKLSSYYLRSYHERFIMLKSEGKVTINYKVFYVWGFKQISCSSIFGRLNYRTFY